MGYYTDFDLTIAPGPPQSVRDSMSNKLREITDWGVEDIIAHGEFYDTKWYDYREDMIKLSESFPEYKFILNGHGEEKDDIWRAWFSNGKSYSVKAQIVWPDFCWETMNIHVL